MKWNCYFGLTETHNDQRTHAAELLGDNVVLVGELWVKACDLKKQGMPNKKIKLALGNAITDWSIQMVC